MAAIQLFIYFLIYTAPFSYILNKKKYNLFHSRFVIVVFNYQEEEEEQQQQQKQQQYFEFMLEI